jgi:hypothetical protein
MQGTNEARQIDSGNAPTAQFSTVIASNATSSGPKQRRHRHRHHRGRR